MQECVDLLVRKYGEGVLTLTLKDSYYNMRKMVEPHPQVIDKAIEAMKMAGVEPLVKPIRGGTDGARLSFMGLPCPNIFTGGMNFHGRYEYCSLTTMHKAMQVILNLAQALDKIKILHNKRFRQADTKPNPFGSCRAKKRKKQTESFSDTRTVRRCSIRFGTENEENKPAKIV